MTASIVQIIRLIDFGLAQEVPKTTGQVKVNRMIGTLEFMSPEVLRCDHASSASDMWSSGVLIYTMISGGILPFSNKMRTCIMKKIIRYKIKQKTISIIL